jgi:hypothetical protein
VEVYDFHDTDNGKDLRKLMVLMIKTCGSLFFDDIGNVKDLWKFMVLMI